MDLVFNVFKERSELIAEWQLHLKAEISTTRDTDFAIRAISNEEDNKKRPHTIVTRAKLCTN
jgi:hypothetical protein